MARPNAQSGINPGLARQGVNRRKNIIKTILITGSTDGIGKLTALKLAQKGHQVYIHSRDSEKLDSVIAGIKSKTGNQNIGGFQGDFSSLDAVKKMADQIKKDLLGIDILINKAGILKSRESLNKEGLDIRFVVNFLAPSLLTELLIPLLKKGKDPRIINLSSAAQAPVSFSALKGKQILSQQESYAQSKLALTMYSFDLARTHEQIGVIAVNPGSLLNTKMVAQAYGRHCSSADKGADILYDLAVSTAYNGVTGKYFDNDQGCFAQAHPDAYDKDEIDRLIQAAKGLI